MRKIIFTVFVCAVSILGASCAGVPINVVYLTGYQENHYPKINYTEEEYAGLINDISVLNSEVKSLKSPVPEETRAKLLEKAQALQERYRAFLKASACFDRSGYAVIVPPESELHVKLKTYCLALEKACPEAKEKYILTPGEPGNIPLLREIMKYTNTKEKAGRALKQHLLWNLENQVKFEDLPQDQKELLIKVDPAAYLKVNSYLKDEGMKFIKGLIPGAEGIESAAGLVKGKVHEYGDYEKSMLKLASNIPLPENTEPIKADGYDLYTIVRASGYSEAEVVFINTSMDPVTVHSYFKPLRDDVQPLAFDLPEVLDEQALKDAAGKLIADIIDFAVGGIKPGDRKTIEENPDRIVDLIKVGFDKEDAYKWTEKLYGGNGSDDESDAFRHAFWNAIMVRDVGDFGETVATNHELNDPATTGSNNMDLFNNGIGREIGRNLTGKGINDDAKYAEEVKKQMGRLMKSPGEKK